jgi:hypothetical protein
MYMPQFSNRYGHFTMGWMNNATGYPATYSLTTPTERGTTMPVFA